MSQEASEKTPAEEEILSIASTDQNDPADTAAQAMNPLEQELVAFKEEVQRLTRELEEQREQFMRKAADMENFRKRLLRDKEDAVLYANRAILADLVPVIDNFERAIKSSEVARDYDALHQGIQMIEQQFVSMLESKYGLTRIIPTDLPFDPAMHEAVMMEDREEHAEAMVLQTFENGYKLADKVLRTAKVKVSRPAGNQ